MRGRLGRARRGAHANVDVARLLRRLVTTRTLLLVVLDRGLDRVLAVGRRKNVRSARDRAGIAGEVRETLTQA